MNLASSPRVAALPADRRTPHAQKNLPNIFASPSLLVTARSSSAPSLIHAISADRMLVESDTHDVRQSAKLVWGAVEWIGRCKGWAVEGLGGSDVEPWKMTEEGDAKIHTVDRKQEEIQTVRILERNWERFMRLID